MAFAPTTASYPPRPAHLFPIPCSKFGLHQTLFQLPRHTKMLSPTRTLLCRLHCHRHSRPGAQPASETQTTLQEHTYLCRIIAPLLAHHLHRHPLLHYSHCHLHRLRPGLDPRTSLHLTMAAHTQLALHFTTLKTQGGRLAIQPAPSPFLPAARQPLPTIPTTTPPLAHHQPTYPLRVPQASRTHSASRPDHDHTLASFEAARQLRSGRYSDLEIYAVRRMATSLEEPGRSRATHLINQTLRYRNLTPPKSNLPFTIPFLAHTSFQADTQRWLAKILNQHKSFAIPLHLPTCRLREAAHPTLRSRLHNHRRWEDHLGNPPQVDQLPCGCNHLRSLLSPDHPTPEDEHLIITLADLQLPTHLRRFLNANMNSTFFPTKRCYWDTFRLNFTKWLRHNGLPITLVHHADSFLTTQWATHLFHLTQEDRFTARSIKQLQEFLGDNVVLHLRIFCPHIYFRGCLATWQSPELFQPLPDDTDQTISSIIQQTYPASLRKKIQMGLHRQLQNALRCRSPEGQEAMEERPYHHLVLQVPLRAMVAHHLQRPQLHDLSASTSIARTTLDTTTMAPFPRLH